MMKKDDLIHQYALEIQEKKLSFDESVAKLIAEFQSKSISVEELRNSFELARDIYFSQPQFSLIMHKLCYVISQEIDIQRELFVEIGASLGTCYLQLSQFEAAERYLEQTLELSYNLGLRDIELAILTNLL